MKKKKKVSINLRSFQKSFVVAQTQWCNILIFVQNFWSQKTQKISKNHLRFPKDVKTCLFYNFEFMNIFIILYHCERLARKKPFFFALMGFFNELCKYSMTFVTCFSRWLIRWLGGASWRLLWCFLEGDFYPPKKPRWKKKHL